MKSRKISRRKFLAQANCAAIGSVSLFSSLLSLRLTAGAASGTNQIGRKALVCLFLDGGNDSFNMLVPLEEAAYERYASIRSNLALPKDVLLPITSVGSTSGMFGIHPSLPYLRDLYTKGDAAFVSNVGTLVEPINVSEFQAGKKAIPRGLFSHADQLLHWQTVVPQVSGASPKGWTGRMAERMGNLNENSSFAMNISLSGNNVLQTGNASVPYSIGPTGAVQLTGYGDVSATRDELVDSILAREYKNLYQKTLASNHQKSISAAIEFNHSVSGADLQYTFPESETDTFPIETERFPATYVGSRLEMIAKTIATRDILGMNRQIFFVRRGGWDHHNELLESHEVLLSEINDAIRAFWLAMERLGLQNDVVLFTASDFGRTLTSNGRGTDHGWGGNQFVIGGDVLGGHIYGDYPDLSVQGTMNLNRGRILPSTSVDAYGAELASWFGVPSAELTNVFPNITNFFGATVPPYPLGLLDPLSNPNR